ncbi:Bax inhibitor-1/YccA family protein [Pseudenhygromyxa sp. WMMC2535]|uniref:Bax inhibitor-1/YccA family protein n=1 Tax=Pseudenhygromyxa sp. WMMC2535 TaxID=2712867 RepID=UPI001552C69F|nr:Bax inhibitor-1/YccA family protein [Pseudenhygromyxa sp. WMMC2535]NVB43161.1 Bax inhibitor-1/YccA family protein [Pseudenhygromyxa sp. WMMC2535]
MQPQPSQHDPHGQRNPYGPGPSYAPGAPTQDPRAQLASGVDQFMTGVNAWMAAGVGVTGIAAYAVSQSDALLQTLFTGGMRWVLLLAPLIFVMIFASRIQSMKPGTAIGVFLAFSAVMGVSLAPIFLIYTGASLASTFAITAVTYGALALWGYTTKRDLSGMGKFLFMGLIGLIVSGIVMVLMTSVFHQQISPLFFMVRAMIGVLIFAGLTAYDTQKIKQIYLMRGGGGNLAILGALELYLDFINLFLFLLRLFGGSRD